MMPDPFNNPPSRLQTRSVKWDYLRDVFGVDSLIPAWVADMDFPAPASVQEALTTRVAHGIYGYSRCPQELKSLIVQWYQRYHAVTLLPEWLIYCPFGVVSAMGFCLQALLNKDQAVVVMPPVYPPLFNQPTQMGYSVLRSPLRHENNEWSMDLAHLAQLCQTTPVAMVSLCSPHNPVGRVWRREELLELAALQKKYGFLVFSDEIHSDFLMPGFTHSPYFSLGEEAALRSIVFHAPNKTFNLAGCASSYIIIPDPQLRRKVAQTIEPYGFHDGNVLSQQALASAYRDGHDWLAELKEVLFQNYTDLRAALKDSCYRPSATEGTYLSWIDCSALADSPEVIRKRLLTEAQVGLDDGVKFGPGGAGYQRLNFACAPQTLREITTRMLKLG